MLIMKMIAINKYSKLKNQMPYILIYLGVINWEINENKFNNSILSFHLGFMWTNAE